MTRIDHEKIVAYLMAFSGPVVVTAVFLPVREQLGNTATVALVQIFVVVLVAIRWGLGPSLSAAVSAMIFFNFFFLRPYYTFVISGYDDIVLYLAFLTTALAVGKLSAEAKKRADLTETKLQEIKGLYSDLQRESRERLQAEETLLESENRFRSLSEESLVGIYILQDSRFRYINRKMVEIFGYEVGELVDKIDPRALVLEEDWPKVRDNLDKRLSNEQRAIHYEFRGVRKDKKIVFLEVFGSRIEIRGKPAVIGTLLDISERKRGEEEIRRLNAELQQKIVQLQEAQEELVRKEKLAILGQLSGSVGHELRNPLGVMSNAVYFLTMVLADADETVKEYLGIIKKEIDTSLRIITDLLDFARTKPPRIKTVTARSLIEESLGRCTLPANVELRDEVKETLPPLAIDPLQMGQVLQNLIQNGVQAMPTGGAITLRGALDGEGLVRLEVADTGEGISPENMKRLFQPLFTTKPKGIGLGLVVCRNLTEAGGGRIEVESEPGKGTTFTLALPVAEL